LLICHAVLDQYIGQFQQCEFTKHDDATAANRIVRGDAVLYGQPSQTQGQPITI